MAHVSKNTQLLTHTGFPPHLDFSWYSYQGFHHISKLTSVRRGNKSCKNWVILFVTDFPYTSLVSLGNVISKIGTPPLIWDVMAPLNHDLSFRTPEDNNLCGYSCDWGLLNELWRPCLLHQILKWDGPNVTPFTSTLTARLTNRCIILNPHIEVDS